MFKAQPGEAREAWEAVAERIKEGRRRRYKKNDPQWEAFTFE